MEKKAGNFFIDYFNFTYTRDDVSDVWSSFLSDFPEIEERLQDFIILQGRSWGFDHVLAFNSFISIRFDDGCSNRGVNVSVTGKGLDEFLSWFEGLDVSQVLRSLRARGIRPSRLDICFDDSSKRFTPKDYQRWFLDGYFNTRMKKNAFFDDGKKGLTFYLGNRKKKIIRIYDKSVESDGCIDAVRYEFEMHGDYAHALFDQICDEDLPLFGDFLSDSFRIVNPDSATRIENCDLLVEWEDFLKSTLTQNYVEVKHYRKSQSWDKMDKWLHDQVFPALKAYSFLYGKSWLMLELRKQKLNDKYLCMLNDIVKDEF